ncbi:XAP5-domain-containing protein [Rhizodiscina lignyota]|uniref:XAP5-domain-containing protein n=1 Tax=Rhizodiscina lignyota TaxID=1504668 RepID=A0A9P4M6K5_9PEZI|nr:XAP5-domain-containing protein [Rhizodiscina lignyota]
MDKNSGNSSAAPSRSSTPASVGASRFTSQSSRNATAEDILKEQTVGLVQLSDFRKRRAEALEQTSGRLTPASGVSTPADGASTPQPAKKKRKPIARGKLSFDVDDDEEVDDVPSGASTSRSNTPAVRATPSADPSDVDSDTSTAKRRLGPNSKIAFVPKVRTKNALLKEAQTREQLRKEFLATQEVVKATDIVLPFVFYDGTNVPGGRCRVKKGDYIWLFLDKARKVGAELGVGGDKSRREWARVSVDDLMLVRNEIILPHHYEFYYFMINKSMSYSGRLFNFSSERSSATPKSGQEEEVDLANYNPLAKPVKKEKAVGVPEEELEGYDDDPTITKVVDRRWYERNKHIFPASVWEEFDPTKDYSKANRKDTEGNSFFFS